MRKLLLLLLALILCAGPVVPAGQRRDELNLTVTLTKGERSRDSGGSTTRLAVAEGSLTYEQSFFGMAGRRRKAVTKEFKLSAGDERRLAELIRDRHLLVTDRLEYTQTESGIRRYFEISVELRLNGKDGAINIKGPANAVRIKDEKLYRNSTALIEELYRIINRTDDEIIYQEPVD